MFPLTICPVVSDSRGRCSSPFPTHRASALFANNRLWSCGQCNEAWNAFTFPTVVVPIYLLAFCMLSNHQVGGSWDKRRGLTPSHGFDLTTAGLLTLQHRGFCGLTHSATHVLSGMLQFHLNGNNPRVLTSSRTPYTALQQQASTHPGTFQMLVECVKLWSPTPLEGSRVQKVRTSRLQSSFRVPSALKLILKGKQSQRISMGHTVQRGRTPLFFNVFLK